MKSTLVILASAFPFLFFVPKAHSPSTNHPVQSDNAVRYSDEKHFTHVRQLTFGGDNAEAYFSFDNHSLVFQKKNPKEGIECDQIFVYSLMDGDATQLSSGKGRTTCPYFMPGNQQIVYASTYLKSPKCPPEPDKKAIGKYVWPVYPDYDIFLSDLNGKIVKQLTDSPGYDAEATVSPNGDKIVFTSMRNGDIDIYTMNLDGSKVKQITKELGYDGGACFSPDGSQIVFRASRPKTPEEIKEYKDLLAQNLVAPTQMELFICNSDGSNMHQVTHLGGANWAPCFNPSGTKIIFSSNHQYVKGFPFNLYLINTDGTGLEKVTHDGTFDAFPMFSFDGKKLAFSSNRNNGGTHDTNVFLADWVE